MTRNRSCATVLLLAIACAACGDGDDTAADGGADLSASPVVDLSTDLGNSVHLDLEITPTPDFAAPLSIVADPLPYGSDRLAQMAQYSLEHYGTSTAQLVPQAVVLHFTETTTWTSAYNLFEANEPNRGELPGTCAHYIVDKDGTIHGLVDPSIRCRHAVGVNHVAIGIEIVQDTQGKGGAWADRQILDRPAQIDAVLHLVKWLQARYGITTANVIGHATANDSPLFKDLKGWTNDHDDWLAPDVAEFRQRLDALP